MFFGRPSRALSLRLIALRVLACLGVSILLATSPLFAAGPTAPLLQADQITYDETAGIVRATGNVEVAMGEQTLRADQITYNRKTDVVKATGHAVLIQTSGEIMHAGDIEITSDMKQGFIEKVGILFPDNSRLAAYDAQRFEGRYLITSKGVYTACNLCRNDPKAPPLWQIKSARITHDNLEKRVIYRDAIVEFDGIPVFYTPYFSHPDPSVKRKQGFLAPSPGHDTTLGYMMRTPFYVDLAPNSDLVLTPNFNQTDKLQMAADWRHRFSNGKMSWSGSVARTDFINQNGFNKGYQWRGHLFGTTLFDLSDTWRAGTNVAFASDKSYMPRYDISSEDLLVNRAYAERFSGRNYAVGNMYYFQDMRPGVRLKEPFVAPELRYSALGEPNQTLGGRWSFNSGLLVTTRERNVDTEQQGANTRRLSFDVGWERQIASPSGFLTNISALARADGYWADNVPYEDESLGTGFSKVQRLRPFAQADVKVSYPLGRRGDGYQQILEPIALLSVAPRVKRSTLLPNEDSLDVEFDETNLFASNRFTGIDRIEGGTRLAYGIRNSLTGDNGQRVELLGGQVFRTRKDLTFPEASGLSDQMSDYVGRLAVSPAQWLDVAYGFKLSREDFAFTRHQVTASAGTPIFRPSIRYLFSKQTETSSDEDNVEKLEEASLGLSSAFLKYWSIAASHSQAFKPSPGARLTTLGLTYKDECFEAALTAERDHTVRVDVESGTTVMFRFFMKNVGGWESN